MKAVVTGGAGFIGSHLVDALLAKGHDVVVVDNLSTGKLANLEAAGPRVQVVRGDVLDASALDPALRGADVVFHLAALPSVVDSILDPARSHEHNLTATLRVLERARHMQVRRVVLASSSAVYGDSPNLPCREDDLPRPLSPYAVAKHASEMYARVYHSAFGLETVALRFFNVFGPRQDPASQYAAAVPRFAQALLAGRPPAIHGDGEQTRDFVPVGDVAEALIKAATAPADLVSGRAFNVASGSSITINRLVAMLRDATGAKVEPVHEPPRPGDVRHSAASIEEARRCLGHHPAPDSIERGLKETVAWFARSASR